MTLLPAELRVTSQYGLRLMHFLQYYNSVSTIGGHQCVG